MSEYHKKRIVIAGGGFAGLAAVKQLNRAKKTWQEEYDLFLIDHKSTSDFLPLAPDVLAGWLNPKYAQVNLKEYCDKHRCCFIQQHINDINVHDHVIAMDNEEFSFDYLILACGSSPNFFGNDNAHTNCLTLNSIADALNIQQALLERADQDECVNVVIIGGGYTGLEIAVSSLYFLKKQNKKCNIYIVEKAPQLLAMIDKRIRKTACHELTQRNIEQLTNDSLKEMKNHCVSLESGRTINNAVCIWSAGVQTASLIKNSNQIEKSGSRIIVDQYLNITSIDNKDVFVVGDNAAFFTNQAEKPIRLAIMYAIAQAKVASQNIIRRIESKKMIAYKPHDLGYLIPLTFRKAPGIVLGIKVSPRLGHILHYFMCIFRSEPSKKWGILKDFIISRNFK